MRDKGKGCGGAGASSFSHAVQIVARAGTRSKAASAIPSRALERGAQPNPTKIRRLTEASSRKSTLSANKDTEPIARAMALGPYLLILDEAFEGLAPAVVKRFREAVPLLLGLLENLPPDERACFARAAGLLLAQLPVSRVDAWRICRTCEHDVCRGTACPVGSAVSAAGD